MEKLSHKNQDGARAPERTFLRKVKSACKKIAAGGLIATSLFLRQPVMADENLSSKNNSHSVQIMNVDFNPVIEHIIYKGIAKHPKEHIVKWRIPLPISENYNIYNIFLTNDKKHVVFVIKDGDLIKAKLCPAKNIESIANIYYPPIFNKDYKFNAESYEKVVDFRKKLYDNCYEYHVGINANILSIKAMSSENGIFVIEKTCKTDDDCKTKEHLYRVNAYRFLEKNDGFRLEYVNNVEIGNYISNVEIDEGIYDIYGSDNSLIIELMENPDFRVNISESISTRGICTKKVTLNFSDGKLKLKNIAEPFCRFEVGMFLGRMQQSVFKIDNVTTRTEYGKVMISVTNCDSSNTDYILYDNFLDGNFFDGGEVCDAFLYGHIPDENIVFITYKDSKLNAKICSALDLMYIHTYRFDNLYWLENLIESRFSDNEAYSKIYGWVFYTIVLFDYKWGVYNSCYDQPFEIKSNEYELYMNNVCSKIKRKNGVIFIEDEKKNYVFYLSYHDDGIRVLRGEPILKNYSVGTK